MIKKIFLITLFISMFYLASADIISINSAGGSEVVVVSNEYIEGFFFGELANISVVSPRGGTVLIPPVISGYISTIPSFFTQKNIELMIILVSLFTFMLVVVYSVYDRFYLSGIKQNKRKKYRIIFGVFIFLLLLFIGLSFFCLYTGRVYSDVTSTDIEQLKWIDIPTFIYLLSVIFVLIVLMILFIVYKLKHRQ